MKMHSKRPQDQNGFAAFAVYGVHVNVFSDDPEFRSFMESNYACFKSNQANSPNIRVWLSAKHGTYAREKKNDLLRFGEGLYCNEKALYWENEFGFSVLVDLHKPDYWELYGFHFNLQHGQSPEERYKDYTRCMRWMVHYPVFLMLERFQGKRLVHATAVSKGGNAIVFTGLNKVGKSSLGHYLYQHHGFKYLSDNFLLADGERVYAFPEKIRLSAAVLGKLNVNAYPEQTIYEKHHLPIEADRIEYEANPAHVFIVNNHHTRGIVSINRSSALKLIDSLHRYLQEFPQFTFYSLMDSYDFWERKSGPLFPKHTRFFSLSVPLDWTIEETANEVMKCISTT